MKYIIGTALLFGVYVSRRIDPFTKFVLYFSIASVVYALH